MTYSVTTLAALLGVRESTIYTMRTNGLIEPHGAELSANGYPTTTYRIVDPRLMARVELAEEKRKEAANANA